MNLTIAEKTLHNKLQNLVAVETKTLAEIIQHLQEVFDTRLFAKMGHGSMIKYLVKELKYSESSAHRRLSALRFTKEIPESKSLIASGELNLSQVSKMQTLFKDQTKETKLHILDQIRSKTTLETEKIIFDNLPIPPLPLDKKQKVSREHTRLSITFSDTAVAKLDRLKARTKNYNVGDLLEQAIDMMLASTDVTKNTSVRPNPERYQKVVFF